jgi:hypothetical protein
MGRLRKQVHGINTFGVGPERDRPSESHAGHRTISLDDASLQSPVAADGTALLSMSESPLHLDCRISTSKSIAPATTSAQQKRLPRASMPSLMLDLTGATPQETAYHHGAAAQPQKNSKSCRHRRTEQFFNLIDSPPDIGLHTPVRPSGQRRPRIASAVRRRHSMYSGLPAASTSGARMEPVQDQHTKTASTLTPQEAAGQAATQRQLQLRAEALWHEVDVSRPHLPEYPHGCELGLNQEPRNLLDSMDSDAMLTEPSTFSVTQNHRGIPDSLGLAGLQADRVPPSTGPAAVSQDTSFIDATGETEPDFELQAALLESMATFDKCSESINHGSNSLASAQTSGGNSGPSQFVGRCAAVDTDMLFDASWADGAAGAAAVQRQGLAGGARAADACDAQEATDAALARALQDEFTALGQSDLRAALSLDDEHIACELLGIPAGPGSAQGISPGRLHTRSRSVHQGHDVAIGGNEQLEQVSHSAVYSIDGCKVCVCWGLFH